MSSERQTSNPKSAEDIAGEAYQVIGALAASAGLLDHPAVVRAMDYFSGGCAGEILPWTPPEAAGT